MSVVVPEKDVETALNVLREHEIDAYVIGNIIPGDEKVILE
jgi:hydrogenase maturation factor